MKLHKSVINHVLYLVENYAGHSTNAKLRALLEAIDLSAYEKKTGDQSVVLVLTEDMLNNLKSGEKK